MAKRAAFFGSLAGGLALDQATKLWAWLALRPRFPPRITVAADLLDLRYAENTGAAFSMMQGSPAARWIFVAIAAVFVAAIAIAYRRAERDHRLLSIGLGLLAAGVLGNAIDRAAAGRVIDFVLVHHGAFRWPVFNVADSLLAVGPVALLVGARRPKALRAAAATRS